MILLDTNYLILALDPETQESKSVIKWYRAGEKLMTSSIAWHEFLCGPVTKEQAKTIASFFTEGIIPFDNAHALEAARLFNAAKRARRLRVDAMIAATAILQQARLATANHKDFSVFVPFGLQLMK